MKPPSTVFVGLGANLGEAQASVCAAAGRLARLPGTQHMKLSRLYRTPAWGDVQQPDFINAVAMFSTLLEPLALLVQLLAIERDFGRDREHEQRWGPRRLDLDLLLYGDCRLDLPGLQLPHPRLHERAFALVPLLELAPQAHIPGRGYARDALSVLEYSDIEPLYADNAHP